VPRRLPLVLAALAAAVAVGVVLLLAGGKDTVPVSTVAKAAEATSTSGGFKFELNGSIKLAQGNPVPIKGSGAIDPATRRGRLLFDSAGPLAGAAASNQKIEQIFEGEVIYMKMPAIAQRLGAKAKWLKVDIAEAGRALGVDPAQFGQLGSNDPRRMLDQIRSVSGDIEKLGSAKVRGADTTRYRAEVDLRKYPERLPEKDREQARVSVERLIDQTGSATYPMELWIDDDDLVRRVRVSYDFEGAQKASFAMTMEFFEFGTAIDVAPPPARDVQDLAELARSLPAGAGQTQ
jgi:hypothetical protein